MKTAAGVLLGTPQYMSPEACESKRDLDHRTDIYALGILLFQMMTGVLPFDGETMGEVLVKQVTQLPPAPRALNPSIPPSVEQILLRCLAKQPDARFPTMIALREALLDPEAYLASRRRSRRRARSRPARRRRAAATVMRVRGAAAERSSDRHQAARRCRCRRLHRRSGRCGATTMIATDGPARPAHRRAHGVPEMQPPATPKMNTMRIATPLGYSSRPPRKMWPIVLSSACCSGSAAARSRCSGPANAHARRVFGVLRRRTPSSRSPRSTPASRRA